MDRKIGEGALVRNGSPWAERTSLDKHALISKLRRVRALPTQEIGLYGTLTQGEIAEDAADPARARSRSRRAH